MSDMLQTFLRMANLYNPQQMGNDMPSELPLQTRAPQFPTSLGYDENVNAQVEPEQPSTLDMFRQSVLNPPKRQHMTYPKSTLNGLTKALEIASTPTDYEKNRVYIDGNAYQQARAYKDPVTGERKFINKYKQPGFGEQVMKAMPAAVSGSVDILNQPYADAVSDWDMRNKGLAAAAGAESQMALANQRNATAGAIPRKLEQGDRALDIKAMDAETRRNAAAIHDLPDSAKLALVQSGQITLAAYRASNEYTLQELRGEQAAARNEATIAGANQRNQATIAGANARNAATNATSIAGRHIAGEEARRTKATPSANSGATSQLPSQKKVALQDKTERFLNKNPTLRDYVSYTDQGFPVVSPDAPDDIQIQINEALYGGGGQDINLPAPGVSAPNIAAPPQAPVTKAPGSPQMPAPQHKAASGSQSMIPMTAVINGKVVERMVPENMIDAATKQGFRPKQAKK